MKKIFTLIFSLIAICFSIEAQDASYSWFLGGGGASADRAVDVVTDANGNIFTANTFCNTASFNGINLTGAPKGSGANYDNSLCIFKLAPDKTNLWNIYSNTGAVNPAAIAVTPKGDLIVTGNVRAITGAATKTANIIDAAGTITTFTDLSTQSYDYQSFVAKFNSNGIIQWVKEINSNAAKDTLVETKAVTVDADGNVYITGNFIKTAIIPGTTPINITTNNSAQACFIAKLNGATGDAVWAKTTSGGIISENIPAFTYGSDGYLYAAGDFKNNATPVEVTFGEKKFTPTIAPDLVLIKLDTDGNFSYIQERQNLSTTASKDVRVKDIAFKNGKVFVGGSAYLGAGGFKFTNNTLTSTSTYLNGFFACFNASDGSDLWQKTVTTPAIAEIIGTTIGVDGNVYAFGYHYNVIGTATPGDADFGDGFKLTDTSNKSGDFFLSSYDPANGTTKEVHVAGKGTGGETALGITNYNDKLYLAGTTNSAPVTFENGSDKYTTAGGFDFLLQCYTVKATSIAEQESNGAFVYFNKASRSVIIKNAGNIAAVKAYDIAGRLVKAAVNTTGTSEISLSGIRSGIYVIRTAATSGQEKTYKIAIN